MGTPAFVHQQAAIRVIRYLKSTPDHGLFFQLLHQYNSRLFQIQIGHDALIQRNQSLDIVYTLVILSSHGNLRNKIEFQDLLPKLSTGHSINRLWVTMYNGSLISIKSWNSPLHNLLYYTVTTNRPNILQQTQLFTKGWSILRLTAVLCARSYYLSCSTCCRFQPQTK